MTNPARRSRAACRLSFVATVCVAALAAACDPEPAADPGPLSVAVASARPSELRSYLARIRFDTAAPARAVLSAATGNCAACAAGTDVRLEPVIGLHTYAGGAVHAGRIIARLRNVGSAASGPVAVAPGDTIYWYMDSTAAAGWRSTFISTRTDGVVVTAPSEIIRNHEHAHRPTSAYYVASVDTVRGWVFGCGGGGCCRAPLLFAELAAPRLPLPPRTP